ncbi:MAG: hypothetical protein ACJATT_005549 [Myxococcota bacterium]|jgi:hypothetical protein
MMHYIGLFVLMLSSCGVSEAPLLHAVKSAQTEKVHRIECHCSGVLMLPPSSDSRSRDTVDPTQCGAPQTAYRGGTYDVGGLSMTLGERVPWRPLVSCVDLVEVLGHASHWEGHRLSYVEAIRLGTMLDDTAQRTDCTAETMVFDGQDVQAFPASVDCLQVLLRDQHVVGSAEVPTSSLDYRRSIEIPSPTANNRCNYSLVAAMGTLPALDVLQTVAETFEVNDRSAMLVSVAPANHHWSVDEITRRLRDTSPALDEEALGRVSP